MSVNLSRYSGPDEWDVYLGLHTQSQTDTPNTVHKRVKRLICHPEYNPLLSLNNDIALMELDSPVTLSQYIWPICLPVATYLLPAGQSVWITGWGKTKEAGCKYEYVKLHSVLLSMKNNTLKGCICIINPIVLIKPWNIFGQLTLTGNYALSASVYYFLFIICNHFFNFWFLIYNYYNIRHFIMSVTYV